MVPTNNKLDVDLIDLAKLIKHLCPNIDRSVEEVAMVISRAYMQASENPSEWTDIRHRLLSLREDPSNPRFMDKGGKDKNLLVSITKKYGPRSLYANTVARVVSAVRLTRDECMRRVKDVIPPAFDLSFRAHLNNKSLSDDIMEAIRNKRLPAKRALEIYNRLRRINAEKYVTDHYLEIPDLKKLIDELHKAHDAYYYKYKKDNKKRVIFLTNGSSQAEQRGEYTVTDLMSGIFCYKPIKMISNKPGIMYEVELDFQELCDLLGIANNRSKVDPYAYIEASSNSFIANNGKPVAFKVLCVPDKDGKIRRIFLGRGDIQVISKGLHEMLDGVAKKLDGNYTYNQKDWIIDKYIRGLFKTDYFLCTDISKFSDTLDRSFMLKILELAGFTQGELDDIDKLYSLPVMDEYGNYYENTLASYQGQYGDFPLITISNLALQYCVYHILGITRQSGDSGAVGDDTGFHFDHFVPEAFLVVKYLYGSAGMNINSLKTSEFYHLSVDPKLKYGVADFVKLRFDHDGIIPFLEPKSYITHDPDMAIRDIFDSMFFESDIKSQMFEIVFGSDTSARLMDISYINGGVNMRPITERDVAELIMNTMNLMTLNEWNQTDIVRWINECSRILHTHGFDWKDTVFSELKDIKAKIKEWSGDARKKLEEIYSDESITDELIKEAIDIYHPEGINNLIPLAILDILTIGTGYTKDDYNKLIGEDPKKILENHRNKMKRLKYSQKVEDLYDIIKSFESVNGRNIKSVSRKQRIKSRVYENHVFQSYEGILYKNITYQSTQYGFDSIGDYLNNIQEVVKSANLRSYTRALIANGVIFSKSVYGHGLLWYIREPNEPYQGNRTKVYRRLYDNCKSSYYDLATPEDLAHCGIGVTLEELNQAIHEIFEPDNTL